MRILTVFLLCFGALFAGGCESVSSLPERFERPEPKLRIYTAGQRQVFEAAQRAVKKIDFVATRAGAAQGIIKAHSALQSGPAFGKARQFALDVEVHEFGPGETQVSVLLHEQEESESFSGATDLPLREHGLYDSFFEALDQELGETGREPGMPAPTR